jgi:hypothetical protein
MTTKQIPLRLPEDVYTALKAASTFTERSMNEIALEAIRAHLAADHRRAEIDAAASKARTKYRRALDRLAE